MKDRSLLLNIVILYSEFLIATSTWNQSLSAEGKKFVTVSSTIECWYTVCPSPNGLMTYWNQISQIIRCFFLHCFIHASDAYTTFMI